MPKDVSLVVLGVLNLAVLSASIVTLVTTVRKLMRKELLVPYAERADLDPGGILSWLIEAAAAARAGEPRPPLFLDRRQVQQDVILGLQGFLVAFVPVMAVNFYVQQFVSYDHPAIQAVRENRTPGGFLSIALITVLVIPAFEELLFRNLLQGFLEVYERVIIGWLGLSDRWTFGAAPIVLGSLIFAGLHLGQGGAPLPLFPFALMLGYLYFQTHRLLPVIVAHAALNGLTMIQLLLLPA